MIYRNILKAISDAQIQSAAVYPSGPYTGSLPSGTVNKGSKGTNVKHVQNFLNWCIKAGLKVDGSCGSKTVAAIKKFQKQYGLSADGSFGPKTKAKAQAVINKYKPAPTPTPTPSQTWTDKANAWAKKIAADNSYHYKVWKSKDIKTHECPICKNYPKGKYHGWNCIGFGAAVWHHGGGLKNTCSCSMISNAIGDKMLKVSDAEALKIAKQRTGLNDIKVIRNKNGIPKSQWKAGDICLKYSGNTYTHLFYYMGSGKVADSGNYKDTNKQIAVRDYKNYSAKIIIRYTGK